MVKSISSSQNPLIKQIIQLQEKSRLRKKSGVFIIEGQREIELAVKGGYSLEALLFCSDIISEEKALSLRSDDKTELIELINEVYQKIAYRDSTEGILAISKIKDLSLDLLEIKSENPLILIAEAPEKPGNIGALLRTADAANLDAVIIANPHTDLFNPNIIRSSVGCIFTNTIALGSSEEIIDYMKNNHISIYCAVLQSSKPYHECDFTNKTAIVVGTESVGLSTIWLENSDQNIIIPMKGEIDSMNVSVAAGILIFEAQRQRN